MESSEQVSTGQAPSQGAPTAQLLLKHQPLLREHKSTTSRKVAFYIPYLKSTVAYLSFEYATTSIAQEKGNCSSAPNIVNTVRALLKIFSFV